MVNLGKYSSTMHHVGMFSKDAIQLEMPWPSVAGECFARQERVGIWQHGPRFKVYLTGNLRQLMASFERHYDVPW